MLLAEHFLAQFNVSMNKSIQRLSQGAINKLKSHHWPGNVRELRNVIERAVILENTPEIRSESLPDFQLESRLRKSGEISIAASETLDDYLSNYEREVILATLERNHYSLTKTADQLKISRHALRYRMQRLNIGGGPGFDDESSAPTARDN